VAAKFPRKLGEKREREDYEKKGLMEAFWQCVTMAEDRAITAPAKSHLCVNPVQKKGESDYWERSSSWGCLIRPPFENKQRRVNIAMGYENSENTNEELQQTSP